jgi:hypothetical protein
VRVLGESSQHAFLRAHLVCEKRRHRVYFLTNPEICISCVCFCMWPGEISCRKQSCRCECPAMIRLLQTRWYITEHRVNHNHTMTENCGEKVCGQQRAGRWRC